MSKVNSEQVGIVFDRIMAPSDPEVFVDQVSILSSAKETVLLLGLLFLQTDSSTGVRIINNLIQCFSNSRRVTQVWPMKFSDRTRRFFIIHWINHLHFFDPQHRLHKKTWTNTYLTLKSYLPTRKRYWRREIVEIKIRNLQSLWVCQVFLKNLPH